MPEPARLALITPVGAEPGAFAPALGAACGAAPVAAVMLWVVGDAPGSSIDLANVAVRGGADGVHAPAIDGLSDLRERLKAERMLGVGSLRSKHDAMLAGEAGVDYLLFGEPRADGSLAPLDQVAERAAWWAEIFETPCLAYAPALDAVERLAGSGAEFVALGEAVWAHPEGAAGGVRAVHAVLDRGGRA